MTTVASAYTDPVIQVVVGDFNNDTRDDVAAIAWDDDQYGVEVYLQTVGGTLAAPMRMNATATSAEVTSGVPPRIGA